MIDPKIEKQVAAATAEAEKVSALTLRVTIDSHAQYEHAASCLLDIKERSKLIETERDGVVKPIKTGLAALDKLFKRALAPYSEAEDYLKARIAEYTVACEARVEARLLAAQVAAKKDPDKARALIATADALNAPKVAGVSFRGGFSWQIVGDLPAEFMKLVPDEKKIDAAVQAEGLRTKIDGLVVTDKRSVAVTVSRREE